MMAADQTLIREAQEESKDEVQEEICALGGGEESEEEENGHSPSHLPLAPSSELLDTTTVDPSYIISLIRKLLPSNISTHKSPQKNAYSSLPVKISNICSLEESIDGNSNGVKKVDDTEANSNSGPLNIVNDRFEGSTFHHFVGKTCSLSAISNGMAPDSRKEVPESDDHETRFLQNENAWEDSGCILWDFSASRNHAELMVNNYLLEVLLASLHSSNSPRIKEICLGILGNLACHDTINNAMSSQDGLIETVVGQLFLDDAPCLVETLRLLTVALQGSESTLWEKALLSEQTCLRIMWIVGNTLNPILLEKSIDFLLTVVNNNAANILRLSLMKWGLPNLAVSLLSSEMSYIDDENKTERASFLDSVLCLVEALSTTDCDLEMAFPNDELCRLVCHVIKLRDKFEYATACVSAVIIIANLLVDGQHIPAQLSQDREFIQGLLEATPFVSYDSQARNAFWHILESLFVRISVDDIDESLVHDIVPIFLEKSGLITEDLDSHYVEDCRHPNAVHTRVIVETLARIGSLLERCCNRKVEEIASSLSFVDVEGKAERLRLYCEKYRCLLLSSSTRE